jgi:predicted transcriptional regulator
VTTTIRVSEETRDRLAALAESTGRPMTRVLDEAVDALERRVFFDQLNRRFEELRQDPKSWEDIEAERRGEETARGDASR